MLRSAYLLHAHGGNDVILSARMLTEKLRETPVGENLEDDFVVEIAASAESPEADEAGVHFAERYRPAALTEIEDTVTNADFMADKDRL